MVKRRQKTLRRDTKSTVEKMRLRSSGPNNGRCCSSLSNDGHPSAHCYTSISHFPMNMNVILIFYLFLLLNAHTFLLHFINTFIIFNF